MYGSRWRKRYRGKHPDGNPDDPVIEERFLLHDGSVEKVEIPISRHPYFLQMPEFGERPQIFDIDDNRGHFGTTVSSRPVNCTNPETPEKLRLLLAENPKRRAMLPRDDDENLMKMIAKICYCFTIYLQLQKPWRPLILRYILAECGDNSLCRAFIGGPQLSPHIRLPNERRHAILVRTETNQSTRVEYVVVRIQLCNINQMPIYDVVVGTTI
jgi:hypothetical protein